MHIEFKEIGDIHSCWIKESHKIWNLLFCWVNGRLSFMFLHPKQKGRKEKDLEALFTMLVNGGFVALQYGQ